MKVMGAMMDEDSFFRYLVLVFLLQRFFLLYSTQGMALRSS